MALFEHAPDCTDAPTEWVDHFEIEILSTLSKFLCDNSMTTAGQLHCAPRRPAPSNRDAGPCKKTKKKTRTAPPSPPPTRHENNVDNCYCARSGQVTRVSQVGAKKKPQIATQTPARYMRRPNGLGARCDVFMLLFSICFPHPAISDEHIERHAGSR